MLYYEGLGKPHTSEKTLVKGWYKDEFIRRMEKTCLFSR